MTLAFKSQILPRTEGVHTYRKSKVWAGIAQSV